MMRQARRGTASGRIGVQRSVLLIGMTLFCLGGVGDLLHHLLPDPLSAALEPLLGADAVRAHLLTFVGMVVILIAVLSRGVRHESRRRA